MGLKIIDKMGWYWTFFSESIGIFRAAGVSGLYQPVFGYYPPDELESEIGKNLSGEQKFLC